MKLLVTGGTGYVGSCAVHELKKLGHEITVFDNLVYGHREALPEGASLVEGDLSDRELIFKTVKESRPEAVLHFASYTYVGESVDNPDKYFGNNVVGSLNLLSAMKECGVKKIIFSSSAGVYGQPRSIPITEDAPLCPESPYGETKVMIEKMLHWFDRAYGIKSISLRYFNAAGADMEFDIGEDHEPESHLIPLVMRVALGKLPEIKVFGDKYGTPDGTCIRDYIHVKDLADAHIKALDKLAGGSGSAVYNLGSGVGTSVKQIIGTARKTSGKPVPEKLSPPRPGDPAKLVASSGRAKDELRWLPKRSNVKEIIKDAWEWHKKHPEGY